MSSTRRASTIRGDACVRYGNQDLGLPRIIAHAMLDNAASMRVVDELRFRGLGPKLDDDRPVLGSARTRAERTR